MEGLGGVRGGRCTSGEGGSHGIILIKEGGSEGSCLNVSLPVFSKLNERPERG